VQHVPVDKLLSKKYLASRAALIDLKRSTSVQRGTTAMRALSLHPTMLVSSRSLNVIGFPKGFRLIYAGFGTGAIPKGCGFTLQNRGSGFVLAEGHPKCVQGGKRPYHTIIPAMATIGDELLMSFGVMGGFMQPQ
jgi:gamma-glutamyltranspeptidase/glutathione hydrolase